MTIVDNIICLIVYNTIANAIGYNANYYVYKQYIICLLTMTVTLKTYLIFSFSLMLFHVARPSLIILSYHLFIPYSSLSTVCCVAHHLL